MHITTCMRHKLNPLFLFVPFMITWIPLFKLWASRILLTCMCNFAHNSYYVYFRYSINSLANHSIRSEVRQFFLCRHALWSQTEHVLWQLIVWLLLFSVYAWWFLNVVARPGSRVKDLCMPRTSCWILYIRLWAASLSGSGMLCWKAG